MRVGDMSMGDAERAGREQAMRAEAAYNGHLDKTGAVNRVEEPTPEDLDAQAERYRDIASRYPQYAEWYTAYAERLEALARRERGDE